jgi:hypothetical protein
MPSDSDFSELSDTEGKQMHKPKTNKVARMIEKRRNKRIKIKESTAKPQGKAPQGSK